MQKEGGGAVARWPAARCLLLPVGRRGVAGFAHYPVLRSKQQPDALFGNAFKSSYVLCMYLIQGVSHITAFYCLQLCANALNSRLARARSHWVLLSKWKKIKHFTTKNRTRQKRSKAVINLWILSSGSISNFPNSLQLQRLFLPIQLENCCLLAPSLLLLQSAVKCNKSSECFTDNSTKIAASILYFAGQRTSKVRLGKIKSCLL